RYIVWPWSTDPSVPGTPHMYEVDSGICSLAHANCTLANVFLEMRYHPAPYMYTWNTRPVNDGEKTILNLIDFLSVASGPIHYEINFPGQQNYPNNPANSVKNVTDMGHPLYPGGVVRTVRVENGEIRIHTIGTGTGPNPTLNEILGRKIFD